MRHLSGDVHVLHPLTFFERTVGDTAVTSDWDALRQASPLLSLQSRHLLCCHPVVKVFQQAQSRMSLVWLSLSD